VKRDDSERGVESQEQMKALGLNSLRRIQRLPELVRSYFRQPECQYALP